MIGWADQPLAGICIPIGSPTITALNLAGWFIDDADLNAE